MPAGQCGRRCGRAPWSWFQTAFLLPSLSDLAADLLALIPHALALVRVRLAELAYVGADPDDLQRLAVPLGHAGDHVGDQRAGKAVQRPDLALVAWPRDGDGAVYLGHLDGRGNLQRQDALGPLHGDL